VNKFNSLLESLHHTTYQISGHSNRIVQVLKEALEQADGNLESDMYGSGKIIEDFQEKIAQALGKESAVFFPSGTMAQQIALRIWCDRNGLKRVAYHPLCHPEIHEKDGLKELHQIESLLLADASRCVQLEDVLNMKEDISCLLLEFPQREIGGQLVDYEELEAISTYCCDKGIKLHLDGARLYETLPYYQKTATEIGELFDSVYISFYKGFGGIAGSILAGDSDFINEAKVWKTRYGGNLISLYPYILSADYYFEQRKHMMGQYYTNAIELAGLFNQCQAMVTRPLVPVSNMFHVHFDMPKEQMESILLSVHEETGVGLTHFIKATSDATCYTEVNIGDRYDHIPKELLKQVFELLDKRMKEAVLLVDTEN
jgi:threonine aldolase